MKTSFPVDRLQEAHQRHYQPGTWELFVQWFERSGYGDVLRLPWLNDGESQERLLSVEDIDWGRLRNVRFDNPEPFKNLLQLRCCLEDGPVSVPDLFSRFVRCTGHTHLLGDFRLHTPFFSETYTSPRFILFDGAGTCLLLGAMFQSLASRCCDEHVQLHYSHTDQRELTHVFASWQGNFVDPDQKTFVPLEMLDQSALFGYLFQQLGVSAYQLFLAIPVELRKALFRKMTLDYFDFYEDSRTQYMYQREQSVEVISAYFKSARKDHCTDLDIYANDFSWKNQMLEEMNRRGIDRPYFLANQAEPVEIVIPAGGSFEIGLLNTNLPEEAALLSTVFLGRVPGSLSFEGHERGHTVTLPEVPWLMVFDTHVDEILLNGLAYRPWLSTCQRFRVLGMGDLESCFAAMSLGESTSTLVIGPCSGLISIVLPINALAIGAGQVIFSPASGIATTAWVAA